MLNVRVGKIEDVVLDFLCGETGNLVASNLRFCQNERAVTSHMCFRVSICLLINLEKLIKC